MAMTKYRTFTGDLGAIARGIIDLMGSLPDESYINALTLGMLPAPLMEQAEKSFREKIARETLAQYAIPQEDELVARWAACVKDECIREFNHELACAVLAEAKTRHILCV
jgi:hypothetical protein